MNFGMHPDHLLAEESRRQAMIGAEIREGRLARRLARRSVEGRGGRLSAFRIWRLHVMVWLEGPRGV